MSPHLSPDAKAIVRAAEAMTEQVRRIADVFTTTTAPVAKELPGWIRQGTRDLSIPEPDPEDEWTGPLIPPVLAEAIRAEDTKLAATTPLRTLISEAMRAHHLSNNRDEADADGNAPCICGNWREPGPMGSDEDDWDNHMADVALDVILPTTKLTAELHRSAEADVKRVITLYERWVKAGPPPLGTSMARWWDARLAELHAAILPPDQTETPTTDQPKEQ